MTDDGESKKQGAFAASPYAPPPEVAGEDNPFLVTSAVPKFPISLTALYSITATALTFGCFWFLGEAGSAWPMISLLLAIGTPYTIISSFVAVCFMMLGRGLVIPGRALAWKLFLVFAIPPASMVYFVPTCIGSSMAVISLVSNDPWIMAIPLFMAYLVTFFFISKRIRKLLAARLCGGTLAPYAALGPDPPTLDSQSQ